MDLQLYGRTALVTGSGKGIGEAIARKLAQERATVIVHGRDAARAQQVADDIVRDGGIAHVVLGDLTSDDAVRRLVDDARRLAGPIGILINNAGGSGAKESWEDTRPEAWASAYDRNVLAAVRVATLLLPEMRQAGWGRVINISSLAATIPPSTGPDYSACKAAMNAMTASMAKATAAHGITVNAVSPGTIHSATLDSRFREVAEQRGLTGRDAPWEDVEQAVLPLFAQVPMGRVGGLDEVADAVAFLASPLAGYITGVNLRVDGGVASSV